MNFIESLINLDKAYRNLGFIVSNHELNTTTIHDARTYKKLDLGGGVSFFELHFLFNLCECISPQRIFIIGNSFGYSSIFLCLINPSAKVVAIDAEVDGVHNSVGNKTTETISKEYNLNFSLVRGYSPVDVPAAINSNFDNKPDFYFIDGEHTNNQIVRDFEACWAISHIKATYLFHDIIALNMQKGFYELSKIPNGIMKYRELNKTTTGIGILYNTDCPKLDWLADVYSYDVNRVSHIIRCNFLLAIAKRILEFTYFYFSPAFNLIPKGMRSYLRSLLLK